jgi:hypothetical protein
VSLSIGKADDTNLDSNGERACRVSPHTAHARCQRFLKKLDIDRVSGFRGLPLDRADQQDAVPSA